MKNEVDNVLLLLCSIYYWFQQLLRGVYITSNVANNAMIMALWIHCFNHVITSTRHARVEVVGLRYVVEYESESRLSGKY